MDIGGETSYFVKSDLDSPNDICLVMVGNSKSLKYLGGGG